jgi:hypothetical protein
VDNGEALVVQIDEGVADDVWRRTTIPFAWSSSTIAIAQMEAASVFFDDVGPGNP